MDKNTLYSRLQHSDFFAPVVCGGLLCGGAGGVVLRASVFVPRATCRPCARHLVWWLFVSYHLWRGVVCAYFCRTIFLKAGYQFPQTDFCCSRKRYRTSSCKAASGCSFPATARPSTSALATIPLRTQMFRIFFRHWRIKIIWP